MEMNGEQRIAAPQQEVWRALNDPEVLKACIMGCESVDKVSDDEYQVALVAAVGPVKARFKGRLQLRDLDPPNSYKLVFEGQGGAAGFAKGDADVKLSPDGAGTLMTYTATAQIGGKLAQVGSRLIDGAARKVANDFFAAFNAKVAPAGAPVEAGAAGASAATATADAASHAAAASPKGGGIPTWLWPVGIAAAVGIYWLSRH